MSLFFSLLSDFECPVCCEYMHPRIYMCINAHCLCKNCKSKISKCPQCSNTNFSYCLPMESIYAKLKFPCRYKTEGCSDSSTNIEQHENQCKYNPTRCCPVATKTCDWQGQYAQIPDHIFRMHRRLLVTNIQEDTLTIPVDALLNKQPPATNEWFFNNCNNDMFQVVLKKENDFVNFTVQYVGCELEAVQYKYKLVIKKYDTEDTCTIIKRCNAAERKSTLFHTKGSSMPYKYLNPLLNSFSKVTITIIGKQIFCEYKTEGCLFRSSSTEQHEKQCIYNPMRRCPLALSPCNWNGSFLAMPAHIETMHNHLLKELIYNNFTIPFELLLHNEPSLTKEWFYKKDNHIFQIVFKKETDVAQIIVQLISCHEDAALYHYILKIAKQNLNVWTIIHKCQPIEGLTAAFGDKGFSIPYKELQKFSSLDSTITIKIIKKKK